MPSPSCPSSVIDQSHPQSANPHDNPLLGNVAEPDSEEEEEEEEAKEEEEYAARLYLPVTHGKRTLLCFLISHFRQNFYWNGTDLLGWYFSVIKKVLCGGHASSRPIWIWLSHVGHDSLFSMTVLRTSFPLLQTFMFHLNIQLPEMSAYDSHDKITVLNVFVCHFSAYTTELVWIDKCSASIWAWC